MNTQSAAPPADPRRQLHRDLYTRECWVRSALRDLRDASVVAAASQLGWVVPTPGWRHALDLARQRAVQLMAALARLGDALRQAIGTAGTAPCEPPSPPQPVRRASPGSGITPLVSCPRCGDSTVAVDRSDPAERRRLTRGLQKARGAMFRTHKDFAIESGFLSAIGVLRHEGLTPADLYFFRRALGLLGDLRAAAAGWIGAVDGTMEEAERALRDGKLPAYLVDYTGMVGAPLRAPCPHLLKLHVEWSGRDGEKQVDGHLDWDDPAATAAAGDERGPGPRREELRYPNPGNGGKTSAFIVRGYALYDAPGGAENAGVPVA